MEISLNFLSYLNHEGLQIIEILPHAYLHGHSHCCRWPGDTRSQAICSLGIILIIPEYSGSSRANSFQPDAACIHMWTVNLWDNDLLQFSKTQRTNPYFSLTHWDLEKCLPFANVFSCMKMIVFIHLENLRCTCICIASGFDLALNIYICRFSSECFQMFLINFEIKSKHFF